jgi:CRP/FNR family transcriptional regulator
MEHCDKSCKQCLGKLCTGRVPIFAGLEEAQLRQVADSITHRSYEKGSIILSENEAPEFLAIISEGSVKACKNTPDGREQIIYIFSEGDFFGEHDLLFNRPSFYFIEALEQVKLCLLYKKDFQKLLRDSPDISFKIINELGDRLRRLESAVQNSGVRSAESRISMVLLEWIKKYGKQEREGILLRMPLSREGLANYIGIARETLSRKLGLLEDEGIVRSVGAKSLLIIDRAALAEIAGADF